MFHPRLFDLLKECRFDRFGWITRECNRHGETIATQHARHRMAILRAGGEGDETTATRRHQGLRGIIDEDEITASEIDVLIGEIHECGVHE